MSPKDPVLKLSRGGELLEKMMPIILPLPQINYVR